MRPRVIFRPSPHGPIIAALTALGREPSAHEQAPRGGGAHCLTCRVGSDASHPQGEVRTRGYGHSLTLPLAGFINRCIHPRAIEPAISQPVFVATDDFNAPLGLLRLWFGFRHVLGLTFIC